MTARTLSRMRWLAMLSLSALFACSPSAPASTTTGPQTTVATSTTITASASTTATAPVGGCPDDPAFVDRGRVMRADQPTSDTNSLGLISWNVDNGCERFEVDFETTEGAPATTPPTVIVDFLESRQVLRVWTDVDNTVVTDQLVETRLVDRLYVVRALDGGMFVDFHLLAPARARVAVSNSPARMTLELQAGSEALASTAAVSDRIVVVSPGNGSVVEVETSVSGYARTFEGTVVVVATAQGQVVAQSSVSAADWVETWGEFETTVEVPIGGLSLFAGEESPEDGSLIGVTLSLVVR